jgi:hypothetical protein
MRPFRPLRWLTAAMISGLAVGGAVTTGASASVADSVVPNVNVSGNCGYGQTCAGIAQPAPVGTATEVVSFTCSATTVGPVAATQATGVACYLLGEFNGAKYPAPTRWLQGHQSATTAVVSGVLQQPYRLCISAGLINDVVHGVANPVCSNPL